MQVCDYGQEPIGQGRQKWFQHNWDTELLFEVAEYPEQLQVYGVESAALLQISQRLHKPLGRPILLLVICTDDGQRILLPKLRLRKCKLIGTVHQGNQQVDALFDLFDMQQKSITDDYWVQKSLDIPLDKCKHQMTGKVNGIQISEHFEQNLNCERKIYRATDPFFYNASNQSCTHATLC